MKRDIFRFLLSAVLVMCCTVMTWAQETPPDDEIWYTSSDANVIAPSNPNAFGATIQSNTYNDGKGVIKFSGPVTMIGEDAFRKCNNLRSITMPNSVTSIGEYAFLTCSNLSQIEIPNSVTSIGGYAFGACAGLTSISVLSGSIGNDAFADCANLSTVTLYDETTGNGVAGIGDYAFRQCGNLKKITIPGTVKSMGGNVFSETYLNDVTIEDGAYIGDYAFPGYSGTLTINGSLSGVGGDSFNGCTVLTSVSVTSGGIGEYAFAGCTNLSDVTLHDEKTGSGVTSIGGYAFAECAGLTSISVLSGSIGNDAFAECANLSMVILYDETTGNGATSIGDYAFRKCGNLKKITIPGTVKSMGGDVFSETYLNDVTIEDGAYIGEYAFQNYKEKLKINGSLSGVGRYAFNGCTVLTSVSVTSGGIGNEAFRACTNLSTVTLGEGVTSIGKYAFRDCGNLKDIFVRWTEAEKIPSIESSVFNKIDISKITLHIPTYTIALYNAKDIWKDFYVYEDVNFIITKTDDTTIEQKVMDGDVVTIDESEDDIKSLVVSENAANVSMTYIRNFANADKWQGWYVPFDVPMADMAKAGLDVANIYGILLDNSGNTVIAFLKMETGTVKANTPYVVRPNTSGKVTLTTTTKLHQIEEINFDLKSATDVYTIGGIYEQTVGDNWYAINKDGQFQKMGADVPLRPLRIWMTIDPRHDNPYEQSASANAKMDIVVIGDGEPTGITSYENDNENDNIYGSTGSPTMYNLNGQRVESQLSILNSQLSISNGHRGIVIRNGKKYLVR